MVSKLLWFAVCLYVYVSLGYFYLLEKSGNHRRDNASHILSEMSNNFYLYQPYEIWYREQELMETVARCKWKKATSGREGVAAESITQTNSRFLIQTDMTLYILFSEMDFAYSCSRHHSTVAQVWGHGRHSADHFLPQPCLMILSCCSVTPYSSPSFRSGSPNGNQSAEGLSSRIREAQLEIQDGQGLQRSSSHLQPNWDSHWCPSFRLRSFNTETASRTWAGQQSPASCLQSLPWFSARGVCFPDSCQPMAEQGWGTMACHLGAEWGSSCCAIPWSEYLFMKLPSFAGIRPVLCSSLFYFSQVLFPINLSCTLHLFQTT